LNALPHSIGTIFAGHRALAQAGLDLFLGQRLAAQVFLSSSSLASAAASTILSCHSCAVAQFGRDVRVFEPHALAVVVPDDRAHLDQIDHAVEVVLGADGDLDRHGIALQAVGDLRRARGRSPRPRGPSC
jgi:hypothetical protein